MAKFPNIKTYYDAQKFPHREATDSIKKTENSKMSIKDSVDERKAFIVGLITLIVIILVIALVLVISYLNKKSKITVANDQIFESVSILK